MKKVISIFILFAMLFTLTACENTANNDFSPTKPSENTEIKIPQNFNGWYLYDGTPIIYPGEDASHYVLYKMPGHGTVSEMDSIRLQWTIPTDNIVYEATLSPDVPANEFYEKYTSLLLSDGRTRMKIYSNGWDTEINDFTPLGMVTPGNIERGNFRCYLDNSVTDAAIISGEINVKNTSDVEVMFGDLPIVSIEVPYVTAINEQEINLNFDYSAPTADGWHTDMFDVLGAPGYALVHWTGTPINELDCIYPESIYYIWETSDYWISVTYYGWSQVSTVDNALSTGQYDGKWCITSKSLTKREISRLNKAVEHILYQE